MSVQMQRRYPYQPHLIVFPKPPFSAAFFCFRSRIPIDAYTDKRRSSDGNFAESGERHELDRSKIRWLLSKGQSAIIPCGTADRGAVPDGKSDGGGSVCAGKDDRQPH